MAIPEFAMNPLATRILAMLYTTNALGNETDAESLLSVRSVIDETAFLGKEMMFPQFARFLSVFHPRASRREKLSCTRNQPTNQPMSLFRVVIFRLFNVSADGQINPKQLKDILNLMAGNQLNEDELDTIVDKTVQKVDRDRDGLVNFEEFVEAFETIEGIGMECSFAQNA